MIYEAIRENASDIHIEPDELFVRIRFRVDGILINKTIVHKNYWSSICVRLKVMSGMNIAESRKPQDGAITMTLQGREIDFRVSSIPTIYGENIVVRVLDKTQGLTSLDELGFNKNNLNFNYFSCNQIMSFLFFFMLIEYFCKFWEFIFIHLFTIHLFANISF